MYVLLKKTTERTNITMDTANKRQRHKKSVGEHPLCAWQSWKIPCTRRHDLQIHPLPVSWRVNCFRHFFQEFEAKKRKWHPLPIFSDIFLSWILNPSTPPYRNSCNRSKILVFVAAIHRVPPASPGSHQVRCESQDVSKLDKFRLDPGSLKTPRHSADWWFGDEA